MMTSMTIEQVLAVLAASPPGIAAATETVSPVLLRAPPAPGEWSATELLAHLRACADVWGESIQTILTQDRPTIRAVSPRSWIGRTDYPGLEFRPSFQAFCAQRAGLLMTLEGLPPGDWARGATITGGGAPLQRTVLNFAERLARHERGHLGQLQRTLRTVTR